MATEIRIVEITFNPTEYRAGNIVEVENTLAKMVDEGWTIVTAGGAGMGYGYTNPNYNQYNDTAKGFYSTNLTGFVILQRKVSKKVSRVQRKPANIPNDVQFVLNELKKMSARPQSEKTLRKRIKKIQDKISTSKTPQETPQEVVNYLKQQGFIRVDNNGKIIYAKF